MAGWLNLLIFATVMKRFRYILAVILSLLIIYVGAGVSVAQYCCSGCETANCCCADKCGFCGKFDFEFHKSCRGEGCTATIYKLDLVKQAFESSVPAPVSLLLCDQVSDLLCALFRDEVLDPPYVIPPPKTSSRHYLALYSCLFSFFDFYCLDCIADCTGFHRLRIDSVNCWSRVTCVTLCSLR